MVEHPNHESAGEDELRPRVEPAYLAGGCELRNRWATFIAEKLCAFSIQAQPEPNFRVHARVRSEAGFVVARFTTAAGRAQLTRTTDEIRRDERTGYVLYVPITGGLDVHQHHRDTRCTPACATLACTAEPLEHTKLGDNDTLYLYIPGDYLDQRMIRGEKHCAVPVSSLDGMGRLVVDTVAALHRESSRMTAHEFLGAARVASDLMLLALTSRADLSSSVSCVRTSNLARAKRVIRARLGDPDLSIPAIARECRLSLRYLHDLFRDDGRTVREYLRSERLQLARDMLQRRAARSTTVTDIALACGFSTPAHFSTAFKQAFGISPREVA